MFKRSLSRNQRSKGSRVKHAFQVCLLVAVCVWLLYQVKHSHDKKKAVKERSSGLSSILEESNAEVLRFGRKDLPRVVETGENTVTVKDDEVNEDAEEAESESEHLTKENGGKDDARVAGEDGIDQNDREEADEDGENGEELESEEEKDAGKDNHSNEARLLNNQEEDPKADTQEAREEQYRADDASSAVVRHGVMMTESEGMSSNEEEQMDTVERDAKIDDSAAGTEVLYEVNQFNASLEQEDIHLVNNSSTIETSLRLPEHESDSLTKSTTFESSNQLEQQHNSTLDVVNGNIPLIYSTAISNLVHNLNSTKGREVTGEDDDSNSADDSDSDRERDLIEEKEKSDMTDRTEDEDSNSAEGDFERERDLIEEKEKSDTTDRAEDEDSNPAEEGDLEREKDLIEEKEKSYTIDRDEDEEDQNVDPLVSDDTSANTVMDDERDVGTESKNEDVAAE